MASTIVAARCEALAQSCHYLHQKLGQSIGFKFKLVIIEIVNDNNCLPEKKLNPVNIQI